MTRAVSGHGFQRRSGTSSTMSGLIDNVWISVKCGFYTSCLLFLRPTTRYGPGIWFPDWQVQTKLKFKIQHLLQIFFRDFDFLYVVITTQASGLR